MYGWRRMPDGSRVICTACVRDVLAELGVPVLGHGRSSSGYGTVSRWKDAGPSVTEASPAVREPDRERALAPVEVRGEDHRLVGMRGASAQRSPSGLSPPRSVPPASSASASIAPATGYASPVFERTPRGPHCSNQAIEATPEC